MPLVDVAACQVGYAKRQRIRVEEYGLEFQVLGLGIWFMIKV